MKIKATRNVGSHKQGDTFEVSDEIAKRLIEAGAAETVSAPAKRDTKGQPAD